jgi:hypothetical protein
MFVRLVADRVVGFQSPVDGRDFAPVLSPDKLWDMPSQKSNRYRNLKVAFHRHLMWRSRITGAVPPPPSLHDVLLTHRSGHNITFPGLLIGLNNMTQCY